MSREYIQKDRLVKVSTREKWVFESIKHGVEL